MKIIAFAALVLASIAAQADAHGWLIQPVSRETSAREDVAGKIGCPSNTPGQSTSVRPGQTISVRYPRNNHIGGFIRWAIVPRGQESGANFDKNVFHYTCRESGPKCVPAGKNEVFSSDNGAPANSILCGDTITLPDWLKAGDYVLQWTWMSAGSSYGNIAWANEQYRSCADLKFSADGSKTKPSCPSFEGGDRVSKLQGKGNDKCFYFYTSAIVSSVFKGEASQRDQLYKYGVPAEVETCKGGGGGAPKPANSKPPASGNATVKPAGSKAAWEFCSSDSECENGCCSDQLSNDHQKKCTPNVCTRLKSGKKDQWQSCLSSDECANSCCTSRFSDDGKMKCTPGGAC